MSAPARIVVLASGRGTNLQALIDATRAGALPASIVGVVSHTASALALARAEKHGIPGSFVAPPRARASEFDKSAWDTALADRIAAMEPDVVVLAGWMRILGPAFLERFPGRVMNLHPALPGELPGLHAIERAYDEALAGRRTTTGVMVHTAVPEVDAGPVLVSEVVPIDAKAPLETLEASVHAVEHRLIVDGARRLLARLDPTRWPYSQGS